MPLKIEQLEKDLWEAADQLRANSRLASSEYCMPVLGVIFLRHAANRFDAATRQIEEDKVTGKMPPRPVQPADYVKRRSLWLPEVARFDNILALPKSTDLGATLNQAMDAIEESFEPLRGVLPKDYTIFERTVLEDLLRIFGRESLRTAGGDVFGRIYEYFLMKFADQKAIDNGEFFTPPSLVQTIVNVIEPEHGIVLDPACGSGGMFVQSSHFIEHMGLDTARRVTFYGQEKTAITIKLAKMNLAVHGLDGDIRDANTYYQDEHSLYGRCDFVMANPPFNVDAVDAARVKGDRRLPFGLPGISVSKDKKTKVISNGNYLWISYFYSYLNPSGRAGFVMSSQASSAGHGEAEVRRKIVETGDVDVMIAIRSNFFYTRTVPCELWFFDRSKPADRRDQVLMLDARSIYRKVTRKIYDFSPEHMDNLNAVVWLYRGQQERFIALVDDYIAEVCDECAVIEGALFPFGVTQATLFVQIEDFLSALTMLEDVPADAVQRLNEIWREWEDAGKQAAADRDALLAGLAAFRARYADTPAATNDAQHAARQNFDPLAEELRGLVKQVDLLYKLATNAVQSAGTLLEWEGVAELFDRRAAAKMLRQFDEERKAAVEALKLPAYFHRQIVWLQDRFPAAEMHAVPGLCKVVTCAEIAAADWSLSPGRYVGVAQVEEDEDFDFEQTLRDIHIELADLNQEAATLAEKIQENFGELGI